MSYKKGLDVLPVELLEAIQTYIDGEYIYIPRKEENRKRWGEVKDSRQPILERNRTICRQYQNGTSVARLAEQYYLSPKTIYKILSGMRE